MSIFFLKASLRQKSNNYDDDDGCNDNHDADDGNDYHIFKRPLETLVV